MDEQTPKELEAGRVRTMADEAMEASGAWFGSGPMIVRYTYGEPVGSTSAVYCGTVHMSSTGPPEATLDPLTLRYPTLTKGSTE